jgi:hypothetical protein
MAGPTAGIRIEFAANDRDALPAMTKFFISYRRDDARYPASRLHAALKAHVENPQSDIFIDVDSIPAGVDFIAHLEARVAECDVLLAVIGAEWMELRNPQTGTRRLDDPGDLVRIEIATALRRGIPVVPVLLDGVSIPPVEQLPEDLRDLSRRNGVPVRHESFESDVARLVERLPSALRETAPAPAARPVNSRTPSAAKPVKPPQLAVPLAAGGLLLAGFIFAWNGLSRDKPEAIPAGGDLPVVADNSQSLDAEAEYTLGNEAYFKQNFPAARAHYEEACVGGKARGCSDLGLLYERGFGVAIDTAEARRLYALGCDGADAFGCERLSDLDLSLNADAE